jgi:hypothetical protein
MRKLIVVVLMVFKLRLRWADYDLKGRQQRQQRQARKMEKGGNQSWRSSGGPARVPVIPIDPQATSASRGRPHRAEEVRGFSPDVLLVASHKRTNPWIPHHKASRPYG